MEFLNIAVILFLIMDPFGNIPSTLTVTQGISHTGRRRIIIREMLIALTIMVLFNFIGEFIFDVLKISETTLRLTSGAILFLVAIKTLFPAIDSPRANLPVGEPFITPIAVPLIASPAILATIMLFAHLESSQLSMLAAIVAAWTLATGVLLSSERLQKVLGVNGLLACEKLMGMVLVMLAIQRFLEGVQQFVKTCHAA
ncbi:MAG: MarC family protein [Parachlamydiaceae bacterium]